MSLPEKRVRTAPWFNHRADEERAELREGFAPRKVYGRSTSVIEFWWCEPCRSYTPKGSYAAGVCLGCRTPRPAA